MAGGLEDPVRPLEILLGSFQLPELAPLLGLHYGAVLGAVPGAGPVREGPVTDLAALSSLAVAGATSETLVSIMV